MEPTIRAGDLLLIDTGVIEVVDDSFYVVVKGGWIVVKRLQRFLGGAVAVRSDNPQYDDETVGPDDVDKLHVV